MELRHLRHFIAVAHELNYTRAAQSLNMAASPLSRSIQRLERELGGPLFERGTRRVALTALGNSLLPRAERLVDDAAAATEALRKQARGDRELTIGARSVPAQLLTVLHQDVIWAVRPGADIRLRPMESYAQIDELLRGAIGLALVSRRVQDARLDYLPVMTEAPAFALPDRPPFSDIDAVQPEHLGMLGFLLPPGFEPLSAAIDLYRDAAREVVRIDTTIMGALAALIATGDYCCITLANPEAPWHRDLAATGVTIKPLPSTIQVGTTYLAWRRDRDTADDLGAILDGARARFDQPLAL